MMNLCDTLGLANRPNTPDCVKWSDDGVLAVAAAHSVVLLNPGDLSGPRAFASAGNQCDLSVLQAPGTPSQATEDAHHELTNLRQGAMVSQYPLLQLNRQARSLAWSPRGCAPSAGCLLAIVTNDHQVLVYGPPSGPHNEWQHVAHLSDQLLDHLELTGWQDLEPQQAQQDDDGGTLRLRGGAKRKRPAHRKQGEEGGGAEVSAPVYRPEAAFHAVVGQAVEVMSAEEGLEGCWFTGTIRVLSAGWALVAYDELQESEEEGTGKLQEWFPVPGQRQGAAPQEPDAAASGGSNAGGQHTVHGTVAGHQLRPAPPPKKSAVGAVRRAGDVCDTFIDSGWWEGCRVAEVQDGGSKVVVEFSGERHLVDRAHTRCCLLYQDGQWHILVAAVPAGAPLEAGGQPQAVQAGGAAGAEQGEAAEERPAKKRRGRPPGSGRKPAVAECLQASGMEQHHQQDQPKKRRGRPPGSGSKLQQLTAAASAAADAGNSPGAATTGAGPGAEAEQHGPRSNSAAAATGAGAETPAAVAAAAFGSQLPSTSTASRKKAAAGTAGGRGSSAKKPPPPTYQVPPDFDPSVLPPMDLSSIKAARSSVPLAFCRRFLALRRLVPEAELPQYEATSSHLKGVDAQLVVQTVAEVMHAHGAALAALSPSLNAKWLNTDGRQRLRFCWDRTRNKMLGGFKVLDDDPSEPDSESETEGERSCGERDDVDDEATESEGEGGSGRKRAKRRRRRAVTVVATADEGEAADGAGVEPQPSLDFPPHVLPEGFSWQELPGVDPSNDASAKRTIILAAVRRFLTLRKQYEEAGEQLPTYEASGSHLRGRDAWLVERVTREFSTAYAQVMDGLGWEAKAFQTYWMARLRSKWDKVAGRVAQGFSLEAEQVDPGVLMLAVGADAEAAEAAERRGPRLQNRPAAKKLGRSSSQRSLDTPGGGVSRRFVGRSEGRAGSGDDSDVGGGAAAQPVRRRKELSASTAAQRMRSGSSLGSMLSSEAYQCHLLGVSSLSCAWSPVVIGPCRGSSGQQQEGAEAASEGGTERCCFLAVGAKAGRVWLWRYRLPQRYSLPPPRGDPGGTFELVACLGGSPGAWVNSLAWQLLPGSIDGSAGLTDSTSSTIDSLVLAVGSSDGSVLLYGADAIQLAALPGRGMHPSQQQQEIAGQGPPPPLPAGMQRWAVVCQPDLRGVTTVALQLYHGSGTAGSSGGSSSSSRGSRLLVAAGKSVGSLAVWCSSEISSSSSHRSSVCDGVTAAHVKSTGSNAGASLVAYGLQGTRAVTGLAWLPPQHEQHQQQPDDQQPLLLVCTHDGTLASYRLTAAELGGSGSNGTSSGDGRLLLHAVEGAPQPASGRRKKKDQGHCALGLAVSPTGLFLAVARLSLSPAAEIMRSLQVHEKVIQGVLQLDRLAGPGAPLDPLEALTAAITRLTQTNSVNNSGGGSGGRDDGGSQEQGLPASGVWEVATLLRLQAKWQQTLDGGGAEAEASVALVPPMAPVVLQHLEQPMLDLLQQHQQQQQQQQHVEAGGSGGGGGGEGGGDELLPRVPPRVWRNLQLATALRHVLHPGKLVREQQLRAKREMRVLGRPAKQQVPAQPVQQQAAAAQEVKAEEESKEGSEESDREEEEEEEAPARPSAPPGLTPEMIARHGAFASLMLAPPPPAPALAAPSPTRAQKPPRPKKPQKQQQQPVPRQQQQQAVSRITAGDAVGQVVGEGQGGEEQLDAEQAALLQQWQQAIERNEMLLLQRHMHKALAAALPTGGDGDEAVEEDGAAPGGAPAAAAAAATHGAVAREGHNGSGGGDVVGNSRPLSQLLMADWITLNLQNTLLLQEMMLLAASVYMKADEAIPERRMPSRETSSLFDAPVAVAGSGVAAATTASCGAECGGALLARCPATLLLCEQRPYWVCRTCDRKYRQVPASAAAGDGTFAEPGVDQPPACIFCGLPLGPIGASVLFNPPCCT